MGFLLCERRGSDCKRPSVSWTKQKKDRAHPVFAGLTQTFCTIAERLYPLDLGHKSPYSLCPAVYQLRNANE